MLILDSRDAAGRIVGMVTLVVGAAIALLGALKRSSASAASHTGQQRRAYLRYLADVRRQLHRTASLQREMQLRSHPEPSDLRTTVNRRRQLWERTLGDSDFLAVRFSTGPQPLVTPLVTPAIPAGADPVSADALTSLVQEYGTLQELPMAVALSAFSHIHLHGNDGERIRNLARTIIAQLVTFHGPDDVRVLVYAQPDQSHEWEWIDHLPHAGPIFDEGISDVISGLAEDASEFAQLISGIREQAPYDASGAIVRPHFLVLCDTAAIPSEASWLLDEGRMGVTLVRISPDSQERTTGALRITVTDVDLRAEVRGGTTYTGEPDALTIRQVTRLARDLSRLCLADNQNERSSG
ncbi:hypothetical protein ABZ434_22305 [Streptomyces sp. NPDC005761]|uniref:hypothetical protein n=1 Tax=unclassified Streptomyces TaxID=2593676 RepID=UPI0033D6851F